MSLYRKYRPQKFSELVGQQHIVTTLTNQVKSGNVNHAYLFCGTRGTGKTTFAKIFARAINCLSPTDFGDPCGICAVCDNVARGNNIDIQEIDAASNNGVEFIRELREEAAYTPSAMQYKVYIIDESHMLTPQACNALLKTLEEPPPHVVFIFATTEPHKIIATIKSRCTRFDLHRLTRTQLSDYAVEIAAREGVTLQKDAANLLAKLGNGSVRDTLSLLDQCMGSDTITVNIVEQSTGAISKAAIFSLIDAIAAGDTSASIVAANEIINKGREVTRLADELLLHLRELLLCGSVKDAAELVDTDDETLAALIEQSRRVSPEFILHAISLLSDGSIKYATQQIIALEALLVKLTMPWVDTTHEAFAARLKKLEQGYTIREPIPPISVSAPIKQQPAPAPIAPPLQLPPKQEQKPIQPQAQPPKEQPPEPIKQEQPKPQLGALTRDTILHTLESANPSMHALISGGDIIIEGSAVTFYVAAQMLPLLEPRLKELPNLFEGCTFHAKQQKQGKDPLDDLINQFQNNGIQLSIIDIENQ